MGQVQRARFLEIADGARVMLVAWAEVEEFRVFCKTLSAGEGETLAGLNSVDGIRLIPGEDEFPLFPFLHREARDCTGRLNWITACSISTSVLRRGQLSITKSVASSSGITSCTQQA